VAGRRLRGGICGLLDLIEEHRAAIRYDWRARFGKGLDSVPDEIGWDEALDLVRVLRSDPSSQTAAAIEGLVYPLSREGWILSDLMDVQQAAIFKKPKPYPRPIKAADGDKKRRGNAAGRSRAQVIEILRDFGHGVPA
jgi:hypothetical protein